jgi:hypothetical protein
MGVGKTTLLAQIFEHLVAKGSGRGNVAVLYCRDFKRSDHTAESLLASILIQLLRQDEGGLQIPQTFKDTFELLSNHQRLGPGLEHLASWLSHTVEARNLVFVLIDSLDDLNTFQRRRLLDAIPHSIRLLVSSRPGLEDELVGAHVIDIRATKHDVRAVVTSGLHRRRNRETQHSILGEIAIDPLLARSQENAISSITESSQDMYDSRPHRYKTNTKSLILTYSKGSCFRRSTLTSYRAVAMHRQSSAASKHYQRRYSPFTMNSGKTRPKRGVNAKGSVRS